ncbi:MAG: mechanosensitive ion channel family protein [Chitinophagaceae bacterium]|nr:mechanosensitive ion channel family protein [Oligoflexus sp.]
MGWAEEAKGLLKGSDYLGVNLFEWGIIFALALLLWSGFSFLRRRFGKKISRLAMRTTVHWDDIAGRMIEKTSKIFLFILSLYISGSIMRADDQALRLFYKFLVVAIFFQAALWGNEILAYGLNRYLTKRYGHLDEKVDNLATYSAINITAKFVLWSVLFLLLLDNLGVNITALVTGLGIGGIAIALAVQNILGDIFASLTIVLDGPFEVGDFIVVEDKSGTVEAIGLKTSRIRALSGEQLIFPNKKLIDGYIQNFKRMNERRVVFGFKVEYETSAEKLKMIPEMAAEIVKTKAKVRLDRSHFAKLGDSALEFEVVYTMLDADYTLYMDTQQAINLELYSAFKKAKINFYFPTPSVVVQGDSGVPNILAHNKVQGANFGADGESEMGKGRIIDRNRDGVSETATY